MGPPETYNAVMEIDMRTGTANRYNPVHIKKCTECTVCIDWTCKPITLCEDPGNKGYIMGLLVPSVIYSEYSLTSTFIRYIRYTFLCVPACIE